MTGNTHNDDVRVLVFFIQVELREVRAFLGSISYTNQLFLQMFFFMTAEPGSGRTSVKRTRVGPCGKKRKVKGGGPPVMEVQSNTRE